MLRLLRECGYRYRGNLRYTGELSDPMRQAFEKLLKNK